MKRYAELLEQWLLTDGKKAYVDYLEGTMYLNILYRFVDWLDENAEQVDSLPDSIKEALNSGDGVYRP